MSYKGSHITSTALISDKSIMSKISDFTNACNNLDSLKISIYLIKEKKFIYCNNAMSKIIGNNYTNLLDKGLEYWYSMIKPEELVSVRNKINGFFSKPYYHLPQILKYHIKNNNEEDILLRHEILLHQLENKQLAINYFFDITETEKIQNYFKTSNNNILLSNNKTPSISPREIEVLKLVADGFSSKQIANKLFISNHTAISHRKNLIEKFNVKNTAQLIKRAAVNIELW